MLDAELVAFGVRHHDPTPGVGAATIVDDAGAQFEEAGDLVFLARSVRQQVQVHPILDRLLLGDGDEHQPRQASIARAHHPVIVSRLLHQLLRMSGHRLPEPSDGAGIPAVDVTLRTRELMTSQPAKGWMAVTTVWDARALAHTEGHEHG